MLLFRLARRKSNAIVALVVTMVAAAASSVHWLARPHLFTLLFLVLFYGALERVRDGRTRLAGVPYLAASAGGHDSVDQPARRILRGHSDDRGLRRGRAAEAGIFGGPAESGGRPRGEPARYFLCGLACLAASLVNPYFYHLHVHVWQYLRDPYQSQHIMEFLTLSFHHPAAIFFESTAAVERGGGVLVRVARAASPSRCCC